MNDHVARTCVTVIFLLACVSTPRIGVVTLGAQTSVSFTDPTLAAGTTQVKAVHIADLRWGVNTFRVDCGLSAYTFTDATVIAGSTTAKAVHITELRTALGQAYVACGASAPTYTDATLTAGTTSIKAVHIEELRAAVTALADDVASTPRGTSYTLDATVAGLYIGHATAIAIGSDNNPIIAYYAADDLFDGDLKVYVCANTSCSSGTARTLDSGDDDVGAGQVSMVIGSDNNPVIAYHDSTNSRLKVYFCADTNCSSGTTRSGDPDGNSGLAPSIVIGSNNNPVIAYTDSDAQALKIYVCADTTCSSGTERIVDGLTSTDFGGYNSIAIGSDGNPVVSFYDYQYGTLKMYVCGDASCSYPHSSSVGRILDENGSPGFQGSSLAIGSDNNPVIAYHAYPTVRMEEDLKLYVCADTSCSSGSASTLDAGGRFPALAIGSDNNPIISSMGYDWPSLKLAVCANASCTSGIVKTLTTDSTIAVHSSIAIGSDNNPVIAYFDYESGDLKVFVCSDPSC
jgi:hypothetical protein